MSKQNDKMKSIGNELLLPLISAASVLRDEKRFRELLVAAHERKINRRKIYEAVLQTYLFAGFPSALISLKILAEYFPKSKRRSAAAKEIEYGETGKRTCTRVYGLKFDKLISNTAEYSPEMAEWLVTEGYGKVLSRNTLPLKERELCIVAVLSSLKFRDQLYSHINGAFRNNAGTDEIERVIKSLDFLGDKGFARFGINVLNSFKTRKPAASGQSGLPKEFI